LKKVIFIVKAICQIESDNSLESESSQNVQQKIENQNCNIDKQQSDRKNDENDEIISTNTLEGVLSLAREIRERKERRKLSSTNIPSSRDISSRASSVKPIRYHNL
jgi:uncharacterized protein YcbK (DUF882 family)